MHRVLGNIVLGTGTNLVCRDQRRLSRENYPCIFLKDKRKLVRQNKQGKDISWRCKNMRRGTKEQGIF